MTALDRQIILSFILLKGKEGLHWAFYRVGEVGKN